MSDDISLFAQLIAWLPAVGISFVVIFLAELGDKTQLVCIAMAARHRPWPVFVGAFLAFILLNVLAVLFGSTLSTWLPQNVLILIVAGTFALFGIQSLRSSGAEEEDEELEEKSGNSIIISAFVRNFRRLAKDVEILTATSENMVRIAMLKLTLAKCV